MVSGSIPERCESIKRNDVVQQNAILWSLFFQMDGVYPNRWLANVAEKCFQFIAKCLFFRSKSDGICCCSMFLQMNCKPSGLLFRF
jgi:hypothetical protein